MWLAFGSRLQNEDTGDVDPIKWSWTCSSSWSVRWWDSGGGTILSPAHFCTERSRLQTSKCTIAHIDHFAQDCFSTSTIFLLKLSMAKGQNRPLFNSSPFLVTWSLYWAIALFGEHLSIITTERRVQECTIRPPWPLNLRHPTQWVGQKEKNFCHLKHDRLILVSILPSAPSSFKLISRPQSERKFCQIRSNGNPKPGT